MREMSEKEAKDRAREDTTSIDMLIEPDDVHDSAESWEDVPTETLRREIHQSVDIVMSEYTHHTHTVLHEAIYRRAITSLKEDLPRVPMSDLVYDTQQEAIENGYWPYKCSHGEVMIQLQELYPTIEKIPHSEYVTHAMNVVRSGVFDGLIPDGVDI